MRLPDPLGAFVAGGAIIGVLGLSFLVGPAPAVLDVVVPVEAAVVAPPTAPAPRQEPEAPVESDVTVTAIPLQVRIGTISVDAPIVPVGLEELTMLRSFRPQWDGICRPPEFGSSAAATADRTS